MLLALVSLVLYNSPGGHATIRTLRHGLEVTQLALSELPGTPNAVWTVKRHASGACEGGKENEKWNLTRIIERENEAALALIIYS